MKIAQLGILFLAVVNVLCGHEVALTLIPPTVSVDAGTSVSVSVAGFNATDQAAPFQTPLVLQGTLLDGEHSMPVELRTDDANPATIQPGSFARRDYRFVLPAGLSGRVILEITPIESTTMRTVLVARDAGTPEPSSPATTLAATIGGGAVADTLDRTFWNHFGAHDAIYFLYGADAPAAKFQLSFKYRLRAFHAEDGEPPKRTVQFGYTQRSLWDIEGDSSPFYDTSYMPSLFFESLAPATSARIPGMTWMGFQTGYQHESNGQNGLSSRSLNTLFFRRGAIWGTSDDWHLIVSPKLFVYVGGLSGNPDLTEYRGYAEWMVALAKGKGVALTYTGRAGKLLDHFSTQLDLTILMRSEIFDFATYFTLQYFSGYGESLRAYDRRTESLRAGFSLVRLR